MIKQAQKMQREMERIQAELAERELEISSGGGAVTIKIMASGDFSSLTLDPEFLKEDPEFVQETLLAAIREASEKAKAVNEEEMGKVSQGLSIPGLM